MTNAATSRLLQPARLGDLRLPHHLVMAPMTRNRAGADGVPGPIVATYYAQRATAGLIIAEAATPNAVGQTYPNITAIHSPEHVAGWRRVTDAVRARGGRMFLQIQHGGRVGHPDTSGLMPVAPSPIPLPDTIVTPRGHRPAVVPREMTVEEIHGTVADFAAAARNALDAGFAGVEVHAANGYLLHQFLSGNTNHRTDDYGGTLANRVRFVVEVVRAVAREIGAQRVGVRVSPGLVVNGVEEDDTERLYPVLLDALADLDLAYLHVVKADLGQPHFQAIRERWSGVLIGNPVLPALTTEEVLRQGERLLDAGADLVSLGRPFLANPDLVERLRRGAPLNPVRDRHLMYVGGETGYTDYPTLDQAPQPVPRPAPATV
ncbi:N-ethylmaleimide reductase [Streptoalloteichus tenebrarius]|uniref:N-ethylmaleimide reductase n=1 Tax=Streptoalloteichus tenebrarius (strain ATCC 17920 / DSM 40477 / JCM 4838 / CBS 697.72 / NBRC 16177 / NCIMB 11028 / NRRL B-12390 / A12253. 1 / ISP 5477) TaxID=1933 RepID=A0ABT1HQC8_STRSD|nr:alkene reductase [Streptoalloteichus tenebrarius]MCP2257660.1 N-ethylmaleimide reductase [Streptoalloteichus tenebrarius]BFE98621.1 alkene reductase [Streptoalloteichus tenebrarius]